MKRAKPNNSKSNNSNAAFEDILQVTGDGGRLDPEKFGHGSLRKPGVILGKKHVHRDLAVGRNVVLKTRSLSDPFPRVDESRAIRYLFLSQSSRLRGIEGGTITPLLPCPCPPMGPRTLPAPMDETPPL